MDRRQSRREAVPEFKISQQSAREVSDKAGPPRQRRNFLSTDHLSTEAAAAYVDSRLPQAGEARAEAHLALCEQCRREVEDQREARTALRGSGPIHMPSELRDKLRSLESLDVEARAGWKDRFPDASQPRNSARATDEEGPWVRLLRRLRGLGN